MCCCNDIISQSSIIFTAISAFHFNTGGGNKVIANLETAKQQNSTKFANFNTCQDQRNIEVHEQSETVILG